VPRTSTHPLGSLWAVIGRVRRWAFESLGLRIAVFVLASGALTDYASSKASVGGWSAHSPAGRLPVVFLVPVAIVWGVGFGILLVKHTPSYFLSPEEQSDDPEKLRRAREDHLLPFIGFLAYGFVAAIPIALVAWGLSALGLDS